MEYLNTILIVVAFGVMIWLILKNKPVEEEPKDDKAMLLLQQQINDLTRQLNEKIDRSSDNSSKILRDQFAAINQTTKETNESLFNLRETNKQVVSFADQLQQLQDILKNPKQRGVLGEYYLETVLKNVLPAGSYKTQYRLGKDENGKDLIPDAVVFIDKDIIPVDSKFSLKNYMHSLQ